MAPKELRALGLLLDHRNGLYGSEFVHLSNGYLNRGTIYALLERLVDKGFVSEQPVPPTTELNLPRIRHKITAQGQNAYNAFLVEQGLQKASFAT